MAEIASLTYSHDVASNKFSYTARDGDKIFSQSPSLKLGGIDRAEMLARLGADVMAQIDALEGQHESISNDDINRGTLHNVDIPYLDRPLEELQAENDALREQAVSAIKKSFKLNHQMLSLVTEIGQEEYASTQRTIVAGTDFNMLSSWDMAMAHVDVTKEWLESVESQHLGVDEVETTAEDLQTLAETVKNVAREMDRETAKNIVTLEFNIDAGMHAGTALDKFVERQLEVVREARLAMERAKEIFHQLGEELKEARKDAEQLRTAPPGDIKAQEQLDELEVKISELNDLFAKAGETLNAARDRVRVEERRLNELRNKRDRLVNGPEVGGKGAASQHEMDM